LVREGWNHLQSQRPLAAWGSWQRALRADSESRAAREALSALESAPELPLAARSAYRFRQPDDHAGRAVWDEQMREGKSEDLAALADLFGRLAAANPSDASAWYNRALCLAWSGHNREAISCLDRVVSLDAERASEQCVSDWALAEILRQGAGAEDLADDLRFACTLHWEPGDTAWLLREFPGIDQVPAVREQAAALDENHRIAVFEWLDRPRRGALAGELAASRAIDVLATVYIDGNSLRLSSPRAEGLQQIEELLVPRLGAGKHAIRREASPLPLALLDADVWQFRVPPAIDPEQRNLICRESVERFYENNWIHKRRHGLSGLSPLGAASAVRRGDAVARARLTAVVRIREQLGSRESAQGLYQGYPFDRLRRRLGLGPVDPALVDPNDLTCASPEELDRLSPAALDDVPLAEAAASAAGLRDDERTARFGSALIGRKTRAIPEFDVTGVVSALVRRAMSQGDFNAALSWIEQARPLASAEINQTMDIWRAEILARAGLPEQALAVYLKRIERDAEGAALALDAAETMFDNNHFDQARTLLFVSGELARSHGRPWIERRTQQLRDRLP
jgi:tetratricopeptide (TPR) repeat protein